MVWVLCSVPAIVSVRVFAELHLVQGVLLSVAYSCSLHMFVGHHNTISLAMVLVLQRGLRSCFAHTISYSASDAVTVCAGADGSCRAQKRAQKTTVASTVANAVFQVAQLHVRMQAAATRVAEEVDELRGGYEDRMSAMRAELQQQEVDKAALLDIVQVREAMDPVPVCTTCLCCRSAWGLAHVSAAGNNNNN